MSFPVHFYNFSKRSNSTKQPSGDPAKTLNVSLKGECSILNPTLDITISSEADFKYNYAYIPKFGRYYFVNDKRFLSDHIVEVSLAVDVLASFKAAIQNTTAFVIYDTTSNSKNIVDKRLETVKNITYRSANFTIDGGSIFATEDRYAISVVGKQGTGTYSIAPTTVALMISGLKDYYEGVFDGIGDLNDLLKMQNITEFSGGNAIQCIRGCIWHPFIKQEGSQGQLWLGDYNTGLPCNTMQRLVYRNGAVNIPWNFSDWRNMSPYTEVYVYLPYVGIVNVNASDLQGITTLNIDIGIETFTGHIAYELYASGSGQVFGTYSADAHVDIPIGINTVSPQNVAQSIANKATNNINFGQGIIGAIGSAASGNMGSFVSSLASTVGNDLKGQISNAAANLSLLTPTATCIGGLAGGAPSKLDQTPRIWVISHDTVVTPSSVSSIMGTPECEVKSLETLTGYVQTQGAEVASDQATNVEINSLNSLLDSGIYIE